MATSDELYGIADELRAVANLGLYYTQDPNDKERYQRVLSLSARLVAALEQRSPDEVLKTYLDNLGHLSPNAGANAAVFLDGRILLIRRHDNGLWALPGGLVEVGETLAEAAARELWEEAQIRGRVTKLLGIFDSRRVLSDLITQMYFALFLVETEDAKPSTTPEATEVGFFAEDDLPELSPGHHIGVPLAFKLYRGEIPVPYFDPPDDPLASAS